MRLNLTLRRKGYILVLVPLVFELLFITVLALLLRQSELEAQRETRSHLILSAADGAWRTGHDVTIAMAMYVSTQDPAELKRLEDLVATSQRQMKQLGILVKGNLRQEQAFARANVTYDKLYKLSSEFINTDRNDLVKLFQYFRYSFPQLEYLSNKQTVEMQVIIDEENQFAGKGSVERSRQTVMQFLFFGVAINILMGIGLAFFFNRSTGERLDVLMDNTVRLGEEKSLRPLLTGSDEIARIDQVFHKMADTLAEAARKERAIVENAVDVICSVDAEDKFLRVNPASAEAWGYEPAELIGRRVVELVPEEERPKLTRAIEKLKTGEPSMSIEGRLERKDGQVVDVSWSAHWSESDRSLFCVAHDITRQKELDRLKKEFVAMITHDLRSPLTGILFSTGLINEGAYGDLNDQVKDELTTVETAVEQMLSLINELLYVEKLEAGKMQMFLDYIPLSRVLERSVAPLRAIADHQKVKLVVPPTTVDVYADEDKLARVMVNLVSNAIKFSRESGEVSLSINEHDGLVEVRITDCGPGIPADKRESIFERFKQVDEKGKREQLGTGLGLAICKEIIDQHGGTIGVESELGKGSTFWFKISAAKKAGEVSEPTANVSIAESNLS